MSNTTRRSAKSRSPRNDTPLLEWLLGGVGLLLLVAALSYLAYEGLTNDDGPGEIVVSTLEIIETQGAYIVRFQVRNEGSQTLADFHLSARLLDGDAEIEVADATIDYLPGRSAREAGVYLRNDPRRYRLEIRPEGFQNP